MGAATSKMPDPFIRRTRRALLDFYDAHRRALPWRDDPRPYRVWISEVMLQQTRVDAVLPYYRAWMERFPDVQTLAAAPLDDVLKAWEGLGYYARARNLHRAALVVRDRLGGALPARAQALRELPGFGPYTAGAVASIAFGEAVPAVDGNVRRVLARLLDEPDPGERWLQERAGALVDPERPGDFNQALMDLGATVCTPRAPRCGACPVHAECAARARGTVPERPRPRPRKRVPDVRFAVALLLRPRPDGARELLLVQRPAEGLLGGLWELPTVALAPDEDARDAVLRGVSAAGIETALDPSSLPEVRQVYSHFRGIYKPFLCTVPRHAAGRLAAPHAWLAPAALGERALPTVHRRIAEAAAADL